MKQVPLKGVGGVADFVKKGEGHLEEWKRGPLELFELSYS